jgi:hypothetical protein
VTATTVRRPTENAAIGRVPAPGRLSVQQILLDRAVARENLDRFGDYLLGGRLQRALGQVGE